MSTTHAALGKNGVTRRDFVKTSAVAGAAFGVFFNVRDAAALVTGENTPDPASAATGQSVAYRLTTCQNCHARCGLMAKVVGTAGSTTPSAGVLVKIDGNPYNPQNMHEDERLGFSSSPSTAAATPGRLCPKGQAGVQVLYDPYRVKHPLKRTGARGAGKWQTITWTQAFSEIGSRINQLIPLATRLTTPINSAATRLGPIANGLALSPGRLPDGEFQEKIWKNTYGTANYRLDHTSICEVSHHVSNELMTGSRKNHFKPDLMSADYVILFGTNYLEANFPMLGLARMIAEFKKAGKKLVVVDPRFSNSAAKADRWVPAKPGTDGAVALALATYIIKNFGPTTTAMGASDASPIAKYLRNSNSAAATADSESTWTDATRLVILANSGGPASAVVGEYLKVEDTTVAGTGSNYVAYSGTAAVEIGTGATAVEGSLLPGSLSIAGAGGGTLTCKTAYEILYENSIAPYSVQYYADIAGVEAADLETIAREFYVAGKKAVANPYRGTVQHTNGLWSMQSVMLLNTLAGNYDWAGGNIVGAGGWGYEYKTTDTDAVYPYSMKGSSWGAGWGSYSTFGSSGPFGPRLDRAKATGTYSYENLNSDDAASWPYPAKRPWGPYWTHGNYQEIVPGIYDQYPYPIKVLITYWNAMPYSTPALKDVWLATVQDTGRLPLYVAIDNVIGEASMYADYILPDTTYLEKWAFPGGSNVSHLTAYTVLRQPVVGSFDSRAWDATFDPTLTNAYNPIYPDTKMMEDIYLGLIAAVGLSTEINGTALPARAWDHWKYALSKLVNTVNSASSTTYPGKPGSGSLTAADVVARGGAYQDPGYGYDGTGKVRYKYGNEILLYYEKLATQRNSMGTASTDRLAPAISGGGYLAVAHYEAIQDLKGNAISDASFPYQLITYKKVLHGQARTQNLPFLTCWEPENFVELSRSDAAALGVKTYDKVRVTSASDPVGVEARAWVTEGLRPGVVAISHHFGHWAQSGVVWYADGVAQSTAPSRTLGIQPNQIMRSDPQFDTSGSMSGQAPVSLQDRIGGSCSFNDTRVNVQKV